MIRALTTVLAICLVPPALAKRLLPGFEMLSRHAELVTLCEWELVDMRWQAKVIEVWKGRLDPDVFHRKPDKGFVPLSSDELRKGRFVTFWNRHNQIFPGLEQVDVVPVTNGRVTRLLNRYGTKEEKTVAELKKLVQANSVSLEWDRSMPKLLVETLRGFNAGMSLGEVEMRLRKAYTQTEFYGTNFRDSSGLTHFQVDRRFLVSVATRAWMGKEPVVHGDAFVSVNDREGRRRAKYRLIREGP